MDFLFAAFECGLILDSLGVEVGDDEFVFFDFLLHFAVLFSKLAVLGFDFFLGIDQSHPLVLKIFVDCEIVLHLIDADLVHYGGLFY
jgi:hypothetical protein